MSQDYGVAGDKLLGQLQVFGPIFQNMGLGLEETAVMMGRLNKAGIDLSRVGPAINKFTRTLAESGQDPVAAMQVLEERIKGTKDESEALVIATEAFGAEGAQRMTNFLREGGSLMQGLSLEAAEATGQLELMAEESETIGEKFQRMKNNLTASLSEVAAPALEALVPVIITLVDALLPVLVPLLEQVGEIFQNLAEPIGMAVAALGEALFPVIEALAPIISALGEVLTGTVIPAFLKIVEAVTPLLEPIATLVTSLIEGLTPILGVVADLIAQVATVMTGVLSGAIEKIIPFVDQLFEALMPIISDVLEVLSPLFETLAGVLGDLLGAALDAILPMILELVDQLGPILTDVIETLMPIITMLIEQLGGALMPIFGRLIDALMPIITAVVELAGELLSELMPVIEELLPIIVDLVTLGLDILVGVIEDLSPLLVMLVEFLGDVVKEILDFLMPAIKPLAEFLSEVLAASFEWVGEKISGLIDWITIGVEWIQKMWDKFQELGGLGMVWDKIKDGFKGMINSIISAWNSIDFGFEFTVPDVWGVPNRGETFGIEDIFPDIPLLAEGGIVTDPTLAVIGEAGAEAVIPLPDMNALMRSGGGGQGKVTIFKIDKLVIEGVEDPTDFARKMDEFGRRERLTNPAFMDYLR